MFLTLFSVLKLIYYLARKYIKELYRVKQSGLNISNVIYIYIYCKRNDKENVRMDITENKSFT